MRMTLQATTVLPAPHLLTSDVPLSVTIRPVHHVEGSFEYHTDGAAFLTLLRRRTDLSEIALELFAKDLRRSAKSRIPAVTFNDDLLQEIGYYID